MYDKRRPEGGKNTWLYYSCSKEGRTRDGHMKRIPAGALEHAVLDAVIAEILSPDMITAMQTVAMTDFLDNRGDLALQQAELTRQLKNLRHRQTNLIEAISETGHTKALLSKLSDMEIEEGELQARITALKEQIKTPPSLPDLTDLSKVAAGMQNLYNTPPELLRPVLQVFIHRITVEREENTVRGVIEFSKPPAELLVGLASGSEHPPPHSMFRRILLMGAPEKTVEKRFFCLTLGPLIPSRYTRPKLGQVPMGAHNRDRSRGLYYYFAWASHFVKDYEVN